MNRLDKFSKKTGWIFVVWINPHTSFIQGNPDNGDYDWQLEVEGDTLNETIKKTLIEAKRLTKQIKGELESSAVIEETEPTN